MAKFIKQINQREYPHAWDAVLIALFLLFSMDANASDELASVTHITEVQNLPLIASEGLKPGNEGWWLGPGIYFNEAKSPFASLGEGTFDKIPEGSAAVLETKIDLRNFVRVDYESFKSIREKFEQEVRSEFAHPTVPGASIAGKGFRFQRTEWQRRVRNYWDGELNKKGAAGAFMDFPGSVESAAGRIIVMRPPKSSPFLRAMFQILGVVRRAPGKLPGSWIIDREYRSFIFSTAGGMTRSLAEFFIPGAAEWNTFVQAGGKEYTYAAVRAVLTTGGGTAAAAAGGAATAAGRTVATTSRIVARSTWLSILETLGLMAQLAATRLISVLIIFNPDVLGAGVTGGCYPSADKPDTYICPGT